MNRVGIHHIIKVAKDTLKETSPRLLPTQSFPKSHPVWTTDLTYCRISPPLFFRNLLNPALWITVQNHLAQFMKLPPFKTAIIPSHIGRMCLDTNNLRLRDRSSARGKICSLNQMRSTNTHHPTSQTRANQFSIRMPSHWLISIFNGVMCPRHHGIFYHRIFFPTNLK